MLKRILEYSGEYKNKAYKAFAALLASTAVNIIPYYFIYEIIMDLLGEKALTVQKLGIRVLGIAICGVLYAYLYIKGLDLSHTCAYHTLENIRISLKSKLENQPLGEIQDKGTGTLKKVFTDDVESIEILLAHSLPEGIANAAVPILIFIGMFFVDWKLAILSMLSLPLGMLAVSTMSRAGSNRIGAYYEAEQRMNNTIIEYVNGMEVVKVFNKGEETYHKFKNDVISYRNLTLDWFGACRPWGAIYNTLLSCVAIFTLPVGTTLVYKGYSDLSDFVLILCMSFAVGTPLLRAISFIPSLPQIKHKIEYLENIITESPLQQGEVGFEGKGHSIEFEKVHFSYGRTEVLHGISLKIEEGNMLALVGESGSGKSTLAKLLVHFYDVSSGSILIGGQDIRKMSLEALNNEISYVSQEQFLFNTTLLENIRIGKPDATEEEVLEAAERAQCTAFLKRLDKGIYTMAGDGGKKLSGGERQRISLARAILKDAPIVVLDEATAFMDPENEEKMNKAIAEIIQGKTLIVIAHRLHSIIHADKICVMKNGEILNMGTHEELLSTCKEYMKLWNAAENSNQWIISARKERRI